MDPLTTLIGVSGDASGSSEKGKAKDVGPSDEELDAYEKALEKLEEWEQKQYIVKQQIFSTISDSLLLRGQSLDRAHEVWTTVCKEDANDVRAHFDSLLRMKEELSGMGMTLEDADFSAIIMSSLPSSYNPALSSLISAVRMAKKEIEPQMLIAHITEEFDRQNIQARLEHTSDRTALLTSDAQKHAHGSCRKSNKDGPTCTNCGHGPHTVANCWAKGGGKEGQGLRWNGKRDDGKDQGNSANVAAALSTDFAMAALVANPINTDLIRCLDTGASHHYSPFRSEFINFRQISPKVIVAADKRVFYATGQGDVILNFPNGDRSTCITLSDVLYAPSIVFMLVSISRIDSRGYWTTFCNGECQVHSPAGQIIARVPRTDNVKN
ncbi:hypothetical protein EWM64_g8978, partial [Hericium alpestre]